MSGKYKKSILNLIIISCFLCLMLRHFDMSAQAATLSQETTPKMSEMGCDILVGGLIEKGDAIELEQAIIAQDKKIAGENFIGALVGSRSPSHRRVCFDSPGGNFIEGLALGKVLLKARKGSAVGENMTCESACALAFMGGSGSAAGVEGADEPDRVLHPLGRLGFHSPSINVPNQTYEKTIVEKAYRIAIQSIAAIVEAKDEVIVEYIPDTDQRTSFRYDIPNSLLLLMLSTSSENMSYVNSVKDASRWGIGIEPVNIEQAPEPIESLANACDNQSFFWMERTAEFYENPPFVDGYQGRTAAFEVSGSVNLEEWRMRSNGIRLTSDLGEYSFSCDVEIFDNIDSASNPIGGATGIGNRRYFYPFQLFSPNTLIKSLATPNLNLPAYKKIQSRLMSVISTSNNNTEQTCAIQESTSRIVNVQNFTNLRRQAGLNGRVIAQLPLGATVSIVNPDKFLRYDRCAAACDGTNQNAIKQCIDNNDVWIEVKHNGRSGFLSRKFLK